MNLFSFELRGQLRMFKFTGNLWPFCPFCIHLGYFKHGSEGEIKHKSLILSQHINMDILITFFVLLCSPQLSVKKNALSLRWLNNKLFLVQSTAEQKSRTETTAKKSSQKYQQHMNKNIQNAHQRDWMNMSTVESVGDMRGKDHET